MNQNELIEKIIYWIYDERVELTDPEKTIRQIKTKLKEDKHVKL